MTRTLLTIAGAGILLAPAATAQAHVSLHPNAIPAGSYVTTSIRVPDEESAASTTSVRVKLPAGVLSALGEAPAGWTFREKTQKLAKPIRTDDGLVTSTVTEVDWTGGRIRPDGVTSFPLTLSIPDSAKSGDVLSFPTLQTYSTGKVVRWIGGPADDTPAPTVDITPAGGPLLDVTGGDAGPPAKLPASLLGGGGRANTTAGAATPAPAVTKVVERQGKGLAIAALVVGALGLLVGGVALTTRRKEA